MSSGYNVNTQTTPMIYQITPLDDFYTGQISSCDRRKMKEHTHLLALAHQEPKALLVHLLKSGRVESQKVCRSDNGQSRTECNNNRPWRAMREIQIQCEEACEIQMV